MHDLNDALDELRHVIPYAHSPSVRKLSKIATLLLAKNYILMQTNALNELRRVLICLHSGNALPATLSASMSALLGNQAAGSRVAKHDSWSPGGATVAGAQAADGQAAGAKRGSHAGNQLAPQAANAAAVDEQQQTSVQNRRRKYNMLINRILGDVAGQHLVNPLQFPPTAITVPPAQPAPPPPPLQPPQQQQVLGSTSLRPIDFCTQSKRPAGKSCSSLDCNTNKRRPASPAPRDKRANTKSALARGGGGGGLENGSGAGASAAATRLAESAAAERAYDSSESSKSGASGCSSLVSVGSPLYGSSQLGQQVECCERPAQCHSASTTASYVEEEEEQADQEAGVELDQDCAGKPDASARCEQQRLQASCGGPMIAALNGQRAGTGGGEEARFRQRRRQQQQHERQQQQQSRSEVDDSLTEMKVNS